MRVRRSLPISTFTCAVFVTAAVAQDRPSYEAFNEGRFLRYLNAHDGGIDAVPRIGLSFGERTIRAVIDSGSTGVVLPRTRSRISTSFNRSATAG